MFGLLYALFMGGACAVDSIKKDLDNEEARQKSINEFDGVTYGTKGRSYYKGQQASYRMVNGHNCIVSKDGRILKDYHQELYNSQEQKDEQCFLDEMRKAREKGMYYFEWYNDIFYSNGDFKLNHPKGFYEVDTLKRFHTMTDENGKRYKMYDKVVECGIDCTGLFFQKYVEADEENKIEISEQEWKLLDGEKNQIIDHGKILFESPGYEYKFMCNSYKIDKKRGRV